MWLVELLCCSSGTVEGAGHSKRDGGREQWRRTT